MSDKENNKIPLLPEIFPKKEKSAHGLVFKGPVGTGKSARFNELAKSVMEDIQVTQPRNLHEWTNLYPDEEEPQLFIAVRNGNIKRIAEIAENGEEDINQTDKLGRNALHLAASIGGLTVCKELVRHGVSLAQKSWFSRETPLHTAMAAKHDHIAVYLASKGAELAPPRGKLSPFTATSNGGGYSGSRLPDPDPDPDFVPAAFERIRSKLSEQQVRRAKNLAVQRKRDHIKGRR